MKQHIAHLLNTRVNQYGSQTCYRYLDKQDHTYKDISWSEVKQQSDHVSHALFELGFRQKSNIGIFSNNCPEWAFTDYGIFGIRGVCVPFFGTATRDQVKYIADETDMNIMFVGNGEQYEKARWLLDQPGSLEKIVYFDESIASDDNRCMSFKEFLKLDEKGEQASAVEEIFESAEPTDIATIIYTSGTTGEPKGVMLTHDNFMFCFEMHDKRLDVTDQDVSMCFLPLSHIFERTWSYYMMHCGTTNVFLENPKEVINQLPKANPTLMCTVPRFFEKTHEGIMAEYHKWPVFKRRIFDWSIKTGHKRSDYKSRNQNLPWDLGLLSSIADKLVLKKLRNIFGQSMRTMPCSGAAIRPELLRFFHATGLFINYGYGATETTATVSCFRTDVYEFDSCGTTMPDLQVKISDQNEILVKGRTVFSGYYKKPVETKDVLSDGWYATGDEGHISEKGNLVMTDRLRDLFKTSVGKYVSPQKIELLIGQDKYIEQIIIFGDNLKYITALIVPSFESIKWELVKNGIAATNPKELIAHNKVIEIIQERLDLLQESLAPFEKVVRFSLLHEPFSVENEAMTSTLKLKRRIIAQQYKELIEKMY
ncbi:MAG: long-chain fatty acid--CoA ligase [Bacteroidetes bacterium]|nr:long-chain fatty acid--CoA ligase [Bacteroidota bacterium]